MKPRLDLTKYVTSGMGRAMLSLSGEVAAKLDKGLFHLVEIRASQINGCAYCIDMHTKEARLAGETEQRLYALSAWRETPFFSDRERAALALTDAVTRLGEHGVTDEVWGEVVTYFDEPELAQLLWAIVAINAWNRMGVATRLLPEQ